MRGGIGNLLVCCADGCLAEITRPVVEQINTMNSYHIALDMRVPPPLSRTEVRRHTARGGPTAVGTVSRTPRHCISQAYLQPNWTRRFNRILTFDGEENARVLFRHSSAFGSVSLPFGTFSEKLKKFQFFIVFRLAE